MHKTLLATAVACSWISGVASFAAFAQQTPSATTGSSGQVTNAQNQADVQELVRQLQMLKVSYAQEVRRLRVLDAEVQALQSRIAGKTGTAPIPAESVASAEGANAEPNSGNSSVENSQAASTTQSSQASTSTQSRSVQDVLEQQQNAYFSRKFTLEDDLTYNHYDRAELTLNGFLALNSIFLGNIAIDRVTSDSLTNDLIGRYAITSRLSLNLDVPFVGRSTDYQQGGAGGSAAALDEASSTGKGLGDVNLSVNYKILTETANRPDTVLTLGVTAPTGQAPYGIKWVDVASSQYEEFAVPTKQPTGNGVWQATVGSSFVKTMDPAIVFGNIGYIHSFTRSFSDIDTDPTITTPGSVKLSDIYYYGAGIAFAFNDRASLSLSFSDRINGKDSLRETGGPWTKIIGSQANAAQLNLGFTYALSPHTTIVTILGMGMTPDAPDFTLTFKVPYMF
ncbi:hypothetical protein [Dyella caseinilytica]|uniref:Outer membrane beta-barrel porin/alpha-amylase n=1 Tax=Dyella caseinilytica TaxID=1849581 RepID=A0ABX7GUU2_9GAMM|nr:hypothetical protein [Dyella caseinilytica]QRN54217.1 hypothetical protein ISN74_02125 [Dyella caseinilytica]GFZ92443.1 hypothetical protein GCM10011408_10000 [Dyella caseinilytica]